VKTDDFVAALDHGIAEISGLIRSPVGLSTNDMRSMPRRLVIAWRRGLRSAGGLGAEAVAPTRRVSWAYLHHQPSQARDAGLLYEALGSGATLGAGTEFVKARACACLRVELAPQGWQPRRRIASDRY
jgi:hypothetical protein